MREDRTRLQALLSALDGSMRGLQRDDCGDYLSSARRATSIRMAPGTCSTLPPARFDAGDL